jgi:hypothetical protein
MGGIVINNEQSIKPFYQLGFLHALSEIAHRLACLAS